MGARTRALCGVPISLALLLVACGAEAPHGVAGTSPPAAPVAFDGPIPDRPASGTLRGRDFTPEAATLEEGILKLRSGEDFFPDLEVKLFLFLEDDSIVPEGRAWEIDCTGRWRAGVPHVHVAWREPGERMPEYASTTCHYTLRLELGRETDAGTIPGRIALDTPGLGTQLLGSFEAGIEGFRIKDGRVDLSQDDLEVAHHLAALWLAGEHGGAVEVTDRAFGWLHKEKPEGRPQAGYSVYWWRPEAGGRTRLAKLQFEKRDGTWAVSRALAPWQVAAAHPISPRDDLSSRLEQRAAQRFEREHEQASGKVPIFAFEVTSGHNPKVGLAEVTVRYLTEADQARGLGRRHGDRESMPRIRYLFRTDAGYPRYNEPEAWTFERRLRDDEAVDFKRGRVVEADG